MCKVGHKIKEVVEMILKIEPKLGIEVYVNNKNTISVVNPNQVNELGEVEAAIVRIHPNYIDAVISALQDAKKEIIGG